MSKEISLMDSQLPAYLQDAGSDMITDSLAVTRMSFPRLSIKGSKFKLIKDGEEKTSKSAELDVVIVAATPGSDLTAKTYYDRQYQPGDDAAPTCMSSNGIEPDANVENPQAAKCATCPQNAWGSAKSMSGKDTKACKDIKVVYFVFPNGDALQDEVIQVRIPTMSLKHLSSYAAQLKSRKLPVFGVKTTLSFSDAEYPELLFKFGGFLNEGQYAQARDVVAGDVVTAIMDGEVGMEFDEAQPVAIQEAPEKKPAPKKKAAPKKVEEPEEVDDLLSDFEEELDEKPAPKKKAPAKKAAPKKAAKKPAPSVFEEPEEEEVVVEEVAQEDDFDAELDALLESFE